MYFKTKINLYIDNVPIYIFGYEKKVYQIGAYPFSTSDRFTVLRNTRGTILKKIEYLHYYLVTFSRKKNEYLAHEDWLELINEI